MPSCSLEMEGRALRALRRRSSALQCASSPPLVPGILALELLFHFRITLPPEGFQVVRDLDRSVVRREDLDPERNPAAADGKTAGRVVEILDSCRNRRSGVIGVDDLGRAPGRQLDPLRGE